MTFCKTNYNSYNIYAMYINFVYKLPMVLNIYHNKPEVNLRNASFEKFETCKNMRWGNFVIFNFGNENNQK